MADDENEFAVDVFESTEYFNANSFYGKMMSQKKK